MRKITADYIYPISSKPIENGVLIIEDNGKIKGVLKSNEGLTDVEIYDGIICPGFVNTHCHLELSHMKGVVNEGNGLVSFIKELMSQREADPDFIQQCIVDAEIEMANNGIVAVGDISNGIDTFSQKAKGNLYYHTFIELYGFLDEQAEESFKNGIELISKYENHLSKFSVAPHSPYSVSETLWKKIIEWNKQNSGIISFHNQETDDENNLFLSGKGSLIDLMQWFGIDTSFWKPKGQTSLNSIRNLLSKSINTQLVHNTFTTKEEMLSIQSQLLNPYWCLCPNANWFIERWLPNITMFVESSAKITLGTDSLSSNWELSILSEMKKIKEYFPTIPTEKMLEWGTKNGADFLQISDNFGTFEKGKKPGINLITNTVNGEISEKCNVEVLV